MILFRAVASGGRGQGDIPQPPPENVFFMQMLAWKVQKVSFIRPLAGVTMALPFLAKLKTRSGSHRSTSPRDEESDHWTHAVTHLGKTFEAVKHSP
jgi:hypothetical protein